MIKVYDTVKKQYYRFDDYLESLTNDNLYGLPRNIGTSGINSLVDLDGNIYTTVVIGDQEWIIENYRCTKYADGSDIPNITDDADWLDDTSGAMCVYNNNDSLKATHGLLYNYPAVTNVKGLAYLAVNNIQDTAWHIPTDFEWDALITELGGTDLAGAEMKDATGFKAVLSGTRSSVNGAFESLGSSVYYASSTEMFPGSAVYVIGSGDSATAYGLSGKIGTTVRLVKNIG